MSREPGRYAWLAVVGSLVLSIALSIVVNTRLAENARDGQRKTTCEIARTQLAIYREEPPSTPTGVAAVRAWRDAYSTWNCED